MLQIAIVVFREVLEIALILGILASATKEIKGRGNYIFAGLVIGILLAITLAFFTDKISNSLNGMGQEFFHTGLNMCLTFWVFEFEGHFLTFRLLEFFLECSGCDQQRPGEDSGRGGGAKPAPKRRFWAPPGTERGP